MDNNFGLPCQSDQVAVAVAAVEDFDKLHRLAVLVVHQPFVEQERRTGFDLQECRLLRRGKRHFQRLFGFAGDDAEFVLQEAVERADRFQFLAADALLFVQRLGKSAIVTDDLNSFRSVADKLGLEHQVCRFHLRRWGGRTLQELRDTVPKEWLWVLAEIGSLLAELSPEGNCRLFELWKQIEEGNFLPLDYFRNSPIADVTNTHNDLLTISFFLL